jgi:opacity protein-like surface antigen
LVLLSAQVAAAQTTVPQPAAPPAQPGTVQPAPAKSMAGLSSAILVRAGYFSASEATYKDIYGSGITYGGELRIALPPWDRRIVLFVEGEYRTASGELTFTKEATDVTVTAGEAGLLFRLSKSRVSPYIGGGAAFYNYEEKSEALGTATGSKVGFVGVGGLAIALTRSLACDLKVKYSSVTITPENSGAQNVSVYDFDAGGLTAGIGIGIRF